VFALDLQLLMKSTTKYFLAGSIVAESRETATGLMVITSGAVGVELPHDQADNNEKELISTGAGGSTTLMCVFKRGYVYRTLSQDFIPHKCFLSIAETPKEY
jgi:hypothetical protein